MLQAIKSLFSKPELRDPDSNTDMTEAPESARVEFKEIMDRLSELSKEEDKLRAKRREVVDRCVSEETQRIKDILMKTTWRVHRNHNGYWTLSSNAAASQITEMIQKSLGPSRLGGGLHCQTLEPLCGILSVWTNGCYVQLSLEVEGQNPYPPGKLVEAAKRVGLIVDEKDCTKNMEHHQALADGYKLFLGV